LQYILSDYGLSVSNRNKGELLIDLGHFLVSRDLKQMTTVLIVDEAHHLSADLLEEIRLLSNLETTSDKLLQIILVGQPELDEKLDSAKLRQLKQRIAVRTRLSALDANETKRYIERRLEIAGASSSSCQLFSQQAIETVYLYSQGLPRVINTICDNALIAAYANRLTLIDPDTIKRVAEEFRLVGIDSSQFQKCVMRDEITI
jgi:type II secretory pathway predicted ATPase ExeA